AMSADASTAIIGGPQDNRSQYQVGTGAAWIFAAGAPVVTTNPTNQNVGLGLNATFTAAATGTPTPTIKWQVSTDNGTSFSDILGATLSTYSFAAAASQNGYQYRAVFTNSVGSAASSAATLTVTLPVLGIQKAHSGNFTQGQQNAIYHV